jgi:glycosyltransferase involved in cell wall biosynthesis
VISRLRARTQKKIQLEIIGEGPEIHKLKKIARRLSVDDIVIFSGPQSRQEVKNAFARSDIFILSSQYEGFPRVLLEAALAGVPAITTSVSGAGELVVDGETGYVVPIGDWDRLVERIEILVSDDPLRRSMSIKARTHGQFVLARTHEMPSQVEIWERLLASN